MRSSTPRRRRTVAVPARIVAWVLLGAVWGLGASTSAMASEAAGETGKCCWLTAHNYFSCVDGVTAGECAGMGGTAMFLAGATCVDPSGPCVGNCCTQDFGCVVGLDSVSCLSYGPASFFLESCADAGCPEPTTLGACCVDGICQIVPFSECVGGIFGAGETCDYGCATRCLLPDGSCVDQLDLICIAQGGTVIRWDLCPGACFVDDTCTPVSPATCDGLGGTFLGEYTECVGACCVPDDTCTTVTPSECAALSGVYQGDGVSCPTAEFTQAPNLPIPDATPSGSSSVSSTIFVDAPGTIADLDVVVEIDHTWIGDLCVFIQRPDRTSPTRVVQRLASGGASCNTAQTPSCSGERLNVTLDDEAAESVDDQCANDVTGTYQPTMPLSDYDGEPVAGLWEISMTDSVELDAGTLISWSLRFEVDNGVDCTMGACCIDGAGSGCFDAEPDTCVAAGGYFAGLGLPCTGAGCPSTCTTNLSTGTTANLVDSIGTIDRDWKAVSFPGGGPGPAYSIAPVAGVWVTSPDANWIDPYGNPANDNDPGGSHVYQIQFTVDFATQDSFELDIAAAVDNTATFDLNGHVLGFVSGFFSFVDVGTTNQAFFVDGVNTLTATTNNVDQPTGLIVQGHVSWQNTAEGCANTDCNGNGTHDLADIENGTSADRNGDGVPDECECFGDTDNNGVVDVDDLVAVILGFGGDGSSTNGDVDGNGVVDVDDLVAVILAWGPCPGS